MSKQKRKKLIRIGNSRANKIMQRKTSSLLNDKEFIIGWRNIKKQFLQKDIVKERLSQKYINQQNIFISLFDEKLMRKIGIKLKKTFLNFCAKYEIRGMKGDNPLVSYAILRFARTYLCKKCKKKYESFSGTMDKCPVCNKSLYIARKQLCIFISKDLTQEDINDEWPAIETWKRVAYKKDELTRMISSVKWDWLQWYNEYVDIYKTKNETYAKIVELSREKHKDYWKGIVEERISNELTLEAKLDLNNYPTQNETMKKNELIKCTENDLFEHTGKTEGAKGYRSDAENIVRVNLARIKKKNKTF